MKFYSQLENDLKEKERGKSAWVRSTEVREKSKVKDEKRNEKYIAILSAPS